MVFHKLVVLGDGGVGKTALTIQLCLNYFVETYDPTIENFYRKQVVIDQQPYTLEVLDLAGQEDYSLHDQWIRDGEGFLLVYAIDDRATFDHIQRLHDQIARVKDTDQVPLILVGNKCDKVMERAVSREEGMDLAKKLNCEFVETSAKTCVNVERAFYTVVRMIRNTKESNRKWWSRRGSDKGKCVIL
jgi:GTPase KRas protein